jgi:hypothetical protein
VRWGWRPLQRLLSRPWNTPSMDWDLRGKHAAHMRDWAISRGRVVIADQRISRCSSRAKRHPSRSLPIRRRTPIPGSPRGCGQLARHGWRPTSNGFAISGRSPPPGARLLQHGLLLVWRRRRHRIELQDGEIRLVHWPCAPDTSPQRPERARMKCARRGRDDARELAAGIVIRHTCNRLMPAANPKVAVVLAGGGARGAYEIGVLSALLPALDAREERPGLVVGSSIGALNAAYLAATVHQRPDALIAHAENIWRGISPQSIWGHSPARNVAREAPRAT